MSTRPVPLPNRRQALQTAGAAAAIGSLGYWTSSAIAQSKSPNEKLNLACIGTANRALDNIKEIKHENIVALCDVDKNYLDQRSQEFKEARLYRDYRELIDKEGDKIDAVLVATADHHHAPATVRALRAGKHTYCEKPLTHTVSEARLVAKIAKEKGLATQMGTQIHAGENYRRVVEMLQSGAIGDVNEVHVWIGKAWGGGDLPTETEKAPSSWIGICGWVQLLNVHLPRAVIIQPNGAAGGHSVPGRWVIWVATTWTWPSGLWS